MAPKIENWGKLRVWGSPGGQGRHIMILCQNPLLAQRHEELWAAGGGDSVAGKN